MAAEATLDIALVPHSPCCSWKGAYIYVRHIFVVLYLVSGSGGSFPWLLFATNEL